MKFYNNCFACYYYLLTKLNDSDSEFTSTGLVFVSQVFHFISIMGIIQKLFHPISFIQTSSKYYNLIFLMPWAFIIYKYYSRSRKGTILNTFKQKPIEEKEKWIIVSVISFIIPLIILFLLFANFSKS